MTGISMAQADLIIAGALAEAGRLALKPLTVAVVDAGSQIIALARQDDASSLRPQIACAKAGGALGLGISSRKIAEMASERPSFIASLAAINPLVPAAGGVIIVDESGEVMGAVGVTGDTSDNDEVCALAGIVAAKLLAQG